MKHPFILSNSVKERLKARSFPFDKIWAPDFNPTELAETTDQQAQGPRQRNFDYLDTLYEKDRDLVDWAFGGNGSVPRRVDEITKKLAAGDVYSPKEFEALMEELRALKNGKTEGEESSD